MSRSTKPTNFHESDESDSMDEDSPFSLFLESLKIEAETIAKMHNDEITPEVILNMSDSQLEFYIKSYGTRIMVFGYCQRTHKTKQGTKRRKKGLLSMIKNKLNKKGITNENSSDNPSSEIKKGRPLNKTRKIEIGWLFEENDKKLKQVRLKTGGGTRKLDVPKMCTCADVLNIGKSLFFPGDISSKGHLSEFDLEIRDFAQNKLDENVNVGEMYDTTKINLLRFYLVTKKKSSSVSPIKLPRVTSTVTRPTSSTIETPAKSKPNTLPTVIGTRGCRSNIETPATWIPKPVTLQPLKSTGACSLTSNIETPATWIPTPDTLQPLKSTGACSLTSNIETPATWISKPDTLQPLKSTGACSLTSNIETPATWIPKPDTLQPLKCTTACSLTSNIEIESNDILNEAITKVGIDLEQIEHSNLADDSGIISFHPRHLDVDDAFRFLEELNDSQESVPDATQENIIRIRMTNLMEDLFHAFTDREILYKPISYVRILSNGEAEVGVGSGVERDTFSSFWTEFYTKYTVGDTAKVPVLRHDMGVTTWQAVARIIIKGYETCGYWPLKIASPFLEEAIFGTVMSDLSTVFFNHVSHSESEVLKLALHDFDSVDKEELMDILATYDCRKIATADNIKYMLTEIAHKEIIQRPMFIIDSMRSVFVLKQEVIDLDEFTRIYARLTPSTKNVLSILRFPESMTDRQSVVANHLKGAQASFLWVDLDKSQKRGFFSSAI